MYLYMIKADWIGHPTKLSLYGSIIEILACPSVLYQATATAEIDVFYIDGISWSSGNISTTISLSIFNGYKVHFFHSRLFSVLIFDKVSEIF